MCISPELAPEMEQNITERLLQFETKNFYYLATATNDLKKVKQVVDDLADQEKDEENDDEDRR